MTPATPPATTPAITPPPSDPGTADSRPTLYLIDAFAQIFRAFFAIRGFTTSQGLPTNAVYGFATILDKLFSGHTPDAVVVCFDAPGDNFRHEAYPAYKSTRERMPDDLAIQLPYIRRLVLARNLPIAEAPGFEADDVIGTLAVRGVAAGFHVTIVSGDKDMMQLIGEHVSLFDPMKERRSGVAEVIEKFSVPPDRVIDIMGLMGDASDNIPGIPGVGEVTAKKLIAQFHDLESVLAGVDEIRAPGVQRKVREHAELARLSRVLVTIRTDLDLDIPLDREHTRLPAPDLPVLKDLYRELEFTRLLARLEAPDGTPTNTATGTAAGSDPSSPSPEATAPVPKRYRTVTDLRELAHIVARARVLGAVSLDLETTSLDPLQAEIVGIALALVPHEGFYIPVAHEQEDGSPLPEQLDRDTVLSYLRPLLTDSAVAKIGQNIKYDLQVLASAGIPLEGVSTDTMIADYLLYPNRRGHGLDAIAMTHLEHTMTSFTEVAGKGKNQIPFARVPLEAATPYAAEDAEITLCLAQHLLPQVDEQGLGDLYAQLEMPLVPVLARMERHGFLVDTPYLDTMSGQMGERVEALTGEIHALAGEEFNIASPKQLQVILFEKLGLKPIKKTKTGFSTDEEVLVRLAQKHPLPDKILELRQYAKLKSTYVDALPALVNPDTGRVHTSLNQTVAATGRLSSTEPNLQNIPIRTEQGRQIRRAFICPPGTRLVSADYSQIELRILAHVSGDAALIDAFDSGEDIHRRTASNVFGIHEGLVTDAMRRAAKAVNFGIIYGMGPYSLALDLGVSQAEAKATIARYFETYSGVRTWLDRVPEEAAESGYVTTLFGRRRPIPELTQGGVQQRAAGARLATNTVIQGTAADIIKRAMLRVDERLMADKLPAKMLLQVHDELIFEVAEDAVDAVVAMARKEMSAAADLVVPLTVDAGSGDNWQEAH